MNPNGKRRAGVGDTLTVEFRDRHPVERKALLMSQRLAKVGLRTLYIHTILSALWDVCGETGDVPELPDVANAIHALKRDKQEDKGL